MSSLQQKRPLSPHLQIYKIQITSLLSILHRGTGILLFLGSIVWALWFVALAAGPESYGQLQALFLHPVGLLFLMGWAFSFFYHLCNGLRHLMWDLGYGYDMPTVRFTGWAVVGSSVVLTVMVGVIGFMLMGIWNEV
ncbi:MAG: succinate dehydrogenase, cytochrome b556 subunit [Proteobacteria bacterium]|nr:succinate dehydrogenase, cytochrome b556 subunit [Pseudomonadota bacterium]